MTYRSRASHIRFILAIYPRLRPLYSLRVFSGHVLRIINLDSAACVLFSLQRLEIKSFF